MCSLCVRGLEEREFFRERDKHAQIKRQKAIFRARQPSWCVSNQRYLSSEGMGRVERTDGLCCVSMILNQNREHAIKVGECTKHDHILCCLNQGNF